MAMETYDFYYGTQLVEFERPEVPAVIAKQGIATNIAGSKYSLNIKPSNSKVVVKNVCN
jgi:hypothetical protein